MRRHADCAGRLGSESRSNGEPGHGPDSAEVDAALVAWRRKVADILFATVAIFQLPVFVMMIRGQGPPMGPPLIAISVLAYLVVAAAALLYGAAYRARLWAFFVAAFLLITICNLVLPDRPFAQAGLVTLPIPILVLVGPRAAKLASLVCVAVILSGPLLRSMPGVARTLVFDADSAAPQGQIWMRAAALTAFLAGLMVLLDRFHRLLSKSLAAQCHATAELKQEMSQRQRLEREMAAVSDEERRRLGHELHDGVCQQVTAALLRCQALGQRLARGGTLDEADLQALSAVLTESLDDAYNVAHGLCPLDPDPDALAAALGALAKRTQEMGAVRCEFFAAGDVETPDPMMAQHLYRIGQESVSNAVRHANAGRVTVELRGNEDGLLLEVEDDGVGLPAAVPADGMGLRTMLYRSQILEGSLTVAPSPGGGTRVTCRVPRPAGRRARRNSAELEWLRST